LDLLTEMETKAGSKLASHKLVGETREVLVDQSWKKGKQTTTISSPTWLPTIWIYIWAECHLT